MIVTNEILWNAIFALFAAVIGGSGVAAFFRRKLTIAEATKMDAETKINLTEFYKRCADEFSSKIDDLSDKYDKLHHDFLLAQQEITDLKIREKLLIREVETLKEKEVSLQNLVDSFINEEN